MQSKVTPNIQAEERSTKDMRAAVKKLSREYRDMKNYIAYIRNKRPIIETYAKCLRGVYCLEQGILSIEDDITRAVAKETLQEGRSCDAVALEMGVTRRMVSYRKKDAENGIAKFIEEYALRNGAV